MNDTECVSPKDERVRQFALLLSAVFLSRLAFAFMVWQVSGPAAFLSPDTSTYVAPAQSLLHGSFSNNGAPEIFRTPGFPLLLVPSLAFQHLIVFSVFENLMLSVASGWLIWRIAAELFPGSSATTWAVLLYCLEPVGLLYSEKILSETLFSTQVLLFVWLFIGVLRSPAYWQVMLSALALAWATYTRPASLYLSVWLIPLLCFFPRVLSMRRRAVRAAVFFLVFALVLAPWFVRNARVADYPGFSSVSDQALYFYSSAAVQAKLERKSLTNVQRELGWNDQERYFQLHPEQRAWLQGRIARFQRAEAERIILAHPATYFWIHARGCAIIILDTGVTEALKSLQQYPESGGLLSRAADEGLFRATLWLIRQYPVAVLGLLLLGMQLLLYYVLAVNGLRRMPLEASLLFTSLFLYFVLVSGTPAAVARYRVPVMPLVCIAAASGTRRQRERQEVRQTLTSRAADMSPSLASPKL